MMQLLTKVTVGGQVLKNRMVLAPMTRGRCTPTVDPFDVSNTIPNEIMGDYYEQRSTAGLVITEATAISEAGGGWLNGPHMRSQVHVDAWKKITDRIRKAGASNTDSSEGATASYLQLWHMGRQSHSSFHPATPGKVFAPSAIVSPDTSSLTATVTGEKVPYEVPHAMTVEEIKETVRDYANAAKLAAEAGFDGVEVHAANGYLLDTFLQSSTNHRTDDYGGSMENRVRFLVEVVEAIIDSGAFPANRVAFRMSPNGVFGGMGSDDNHDMFIFVAERMNKYGLAYLHLLDGLGFGFHDKSPVVSAHDIKSKFDGPIICNVGLTKESAEGMLRSGAADLCCFGRLYISNPDLPQRFANDWPVEPEAAYDTWWYPTGSKGYTDWPAYQPPATEVEDSA